MAIENSALLPQRQEPRFCLKHAHFAAHPEYVMQNQIRIHLNGVSHDPRRAGHGDQGAGSTCALLDVRRGCARLRGGSQRQGDLTHPGQSPSKAVPNKGDTVKRFQEGKQCH